MLRAYGEITIAQIDDGENGTSPYFVSVGNESQNIPCTNSGLTSINMLIEIPFEGYLGLERTDCSVAVGALPSGITLGEKTDATSTKSGKVVLNVAENSNLGSSNVLTGTIPLTFTLGSQKMTKNFTWTKSKAGDQGISGKNARIYMLESFDAIMKRNTDDTLSPATLTFNSYYSDGNESKRNPYKGRFIIYESTDNLTYTTKYSSISDESTISYSPTTAKITSVRAELYASGGIVNKLDSQTIIVLTDADGVNSALSEVKQTVSGVSSKVDSVEKSITDKVWQTDITNTINNYDNTTVKEIKNSVAENTTKIGEITSTVSGLSTKIESKADGSKVTSLEKDISSVKQTQEGFTQTVEKMQSQLDGNIQTWTTDDVPTLDNNPVTEWTKNGETNESHIGDICYDKENHAYRFRKNKDGSFEWQLLKDTDVTKALEDAKNAQTTASEAKSSIEQTAGEIRQEVSKTLEDYSTTEKVSGMIDNKGDEIITAVSQTYAKTVEVQYYTSTSAIELIGGTWNTGTPTWEVAKYIWQRTATTRGDGNVTYSNPVCIQGAKGEQGNIGEQGTSVISITPQYYISTSPTGLADGSWSEERPTWEENKYIWTRSKIIYKNPTKTEYTNAICDTATLVGAQLTTKIDSIEQRVTDAEGNITSVKTTADGVATEIKNARGDKATLSEKVNEITASIEDTDGKVSKLEVTTNGISQEMSDARGKDANLKVTLDNIRSSVSDASSSIEKLEIGGANLVVGTLTASTDGWISYGKTDTDKGNFYTYNNGVYCLKYVNGQRFAVYNLSSYIGKTVTVSCEFTNRHVTGDEHVNTSDITMQLCQTEAIDAGGNVSYTGKEILSDAVVIPNAQTDLGTTVHFSQTLKLEEGYVGFCLNTKQLDAASTVYVLIEHLKIETGNKETSYTPNTQDITDIINNVQNDANINNEEKQQLIDSLNNDLKILSDDYDSYKKNTTLSSLIEQNPDGFATSVKKTVENQFSETNSKISSVESKVTQNEEYWKATFKRIGAENVIVSDGKPVPTSETVSITLSPDGVRVEGDDGQFTIMDKKGLAGYYESLDNCVFKIQEDITITKRLQVENGIDFLTLKEIPLTYNYNGQEIKALVDVVSGGTS